MSKSGCEGGSTVLVVPTTGQTDALAAMVVVLAFIYMLGLLVLEGLSVDLGRCWCVDADVDVLFVPGE